MKTFYHLIDTGFNRGITRNEDWWRYRLRIFENFTLKSLQNQTNKNFSILMRLRSNYTIVNELEDVLKKSLIPYVIVYDDLPGDEELKMKKVCSSVDTIFSTRVDTDDLFHQNAIQEIQKQNFSWRKAIVFQNGYCFDCVNNRLQTYFAMSPPFSTIMFPSEIFLDIEKRKEYIGELHGHDQVFSHFSSVVIPDRRFIVLVHSNNNRTRYLENEISIGRIEIPTEKHENILKEFGISTNTYKQEWKELENKI